MSATPTPRPVLILLVLGMMLTAFVGSAGAKPSHKPANKAPKLHSVTGPTTTTVTNIQLHVNATDADGNVKQIRFKNDAKGWDNWRPYKSAIWQTIPAGNGLHYISVQVQDNDGATSEIGRAHV